MAVNKTIVQGRLTRDPELRATQNGVPVVAFTLAWSEKYKDRERKLFLPVVAWDHQAAFVSNYFSKGQECICEGKLTTRQWQDRDGSNRETIELVADNIHFCGPRQNQPAQYQQPAYQQPAAPQQDFTPMDSEDDVPF